MTFINKFLRPADHTISAKPKDGGCRRSILKNVKILVEDLGIDVRVILKIVLEEQTVRMRSRFT